MNTSLFQSFQHLLSTNPALGLRVRMRSEWGVGGGWRGSGSEEAGGKIHGVCSARNLELPSDSRTLESYCTYFTCLSI